GRQGRGDAERLDARALVKLGAERRERAPLQRLLGGRRQFAHTGGRLAGWLARPAAEALLDEAGDGLTWRIAERVCEPELLAEGDTLAERQDRDQPLENVRGERHAQRHEALRAQAGHGSAEDAPPQLRVGRAASEPAVHEARELGAL